MEPVSTGDMNVDNIKVEQVEEIATFDEDQGKSLETLIKILNSLFQLFVRYLLLGEYIWWWRKSQEWRVFSRYVRRCESSKSFETKANRR